ncbi:MAG: hypothetical protein DCF20_03670 [Pseudanabaena sp.]|nr:MAG: hypothetical protein DCF20_03670 [Pseudanabaena sp.]
MKIIIDMNLSPDWCAVFANHDISALHWSSVGNMRDSDRVIMEWAKQNDYIVFTHDLDFGTLLASTQSNAPSVIQVRTQDTFPDAIANIVIAALSQFEPELKDGALITIDDSRSRVRILPIRRNK